MITAVAHRSLCAVVIALGLTAPALGQATPPLSREDAAAVSITAKVTAINQTTREVTLQGPLGNTVTFTVDKHVTRLNEIKVGDEVTADYYVSYAADVRPPTEAEKAAPIQVLTDTAKAPAGSEPAAGALHITRAVVTIEGLDRPTKCITVKGPGGRFMTIQVADVANLSKVHIGDTIVVTYTEALAVSLQKKTSK